jgi:hypothetical protein
MEPSQTPPPLSSVPVSDTSSRKMSWIVIGGIVLAALLLFGLSNSTFFSKSASVSDVADCVVEKKVTLADVKEPEQKPWVVAEPPAGITTGTILVPDGSRDVHGLVDDTIVGFPLIAQNPLFKNSLGSLKFLYQGNLNTYAVDKDRAYFIYPQTIGAWKGEQQVMVIPNADVESFTALQSPVFGYTGFAKDKYHVYFRGVVVPDVTPSNFKLLDSQFGLTADSAGNLVLLSGNATSVEDGDLLSRRTLNPLEAQYVTLLSNNPKNPFSFMFSTLTEPVPTGSKIALLTNSFSRGREATYIPWIYGVYKPGSEKPIVCIASGNFVEDSVIYKSHGLLKMTNGNPNIVDVDFSTSNIAASFVPAGPDKFPQLLLDKVNNALFIVANTETDTRSTNFNLTKFSFDDVVSHTMANGKILFQGQGSSLGQVVLSPDGTLGAGLLGTNNSFDLVLFKLTDNSTQRVATASRGKSTFAPVFFSPDNKDIYYYFQAYEYFDGDSPVLYKHSLSGIESDFGTEKEVTPLKFANYLLSGDSKTAYYNYATKPLVACGASGYNYTNAIGSYDTVSGTTKELLIAPDTAILGRMEMDSMHNELVVQLHASIASTTRNGGSCIEQGDSIEIKHIPL